MLGKGIESNIRRSVGANDFRTWKKYKVDRVKSLQVQAMHKTVDDRLHRDVFVCLVLRSQSATEQIHSRMQIGLASGPEVCDYNTSAASCAPYQVHTNAC